MRLRAIVPVLCVSMGLAACTNPHFTVAESPSNEALYTSLFPYYAEFCALSELIKKPGHGIAIASAGPGGHSALYLNGVCRVDDAGYPTIAMCPAGGAMAGRGVGLSVNAHFQNTNWVAVEGRDFLFNGAVAPGAGLSEAGYERTRKAARRMGIYDGVVFHQAAFEGKPAEMSERDYMYDVSVGTDYALAFGRDRYCARVPMERAEMATIVDFLNGINAPYRSGRKTFEWDVLRNNCAHLVHNALAAVGLWEEWRTDRFILIAAFDFPVPKNEFVNLMRRTNDMPLADPPALYQDRATRIALERARRIPTSPGALAQAERAMSPNALFATDLRLMFYDEPILFGHYQEHFDQIFSERRYTDLHENLAYFSSLYATIIAAPSVPARLPAASDDSDRSAFASSYRDYVKRQKATVDRWLAALPDARQAGLRPGEGGT
jgi:hypothetical protein